MKKSALLIILFIATLSVNQTVLGQIKLPAIVRDSMVLQRNSEINVWGWAKKGEKVSIKFKGKKYKTTTGKDGKWLVKLAPTPAGGPYTMKISGSNTIELKNILVGDVWLCTGQSNMVHYLKVHNERYATDIAEANYPEIRQFWVPNKNELSGPKEDLPGGNWKWANPKDVNYFSVIAYFFAKKIHEKYNIPVGIINASVGGTPIEAWTSEEGLKEFPDIAARIERNKDTAYVNGANRAVMEFRKKQGPKKEADKGLVGEKTWFDTIYEPLNWRTINIPGYWEDQGIRNLDGVVWYRKIVDIPTSMTGVPAKLAMGRIVDADEVYINGIKVGNTTYQYPQRRYMIADNVLKAGKNIFVIRVTNQGGKGGFVPDKPYYITAANDTIDLKGTWHYKVGEVYVRDTERGPMGIYAQNEPTALYNAMIAPITKYAIKGVLWYQGESNAGNAELYKKLLPAYIKDLRNQWKDEKLPVLVAQLPNFMDVDYLPVKNSGWAMMREAQLEVLDIPNTGLAVTIDLGEWNDIHPDNKKPVGDRLALAAEHLVYGEKDIVYSGPLLKSAEIKDNKILLTFDHVGSGLVSGNGEELAHFAIAGADMKFKWGKAVIEGKDKVIVWNEDIPEPKYIRYAWSDNPDFANLYNKEGLPASPFRTDE